MLNTPKPALDYTSVSMVIDHLSLRDSDDLSQKFVFSTQTVDTALLALLAYYDMAGIMATPQALDVVRQAALSTDGVYVLQTRENVQVIASVEVWQKMVADPRFGAGSMLQVSLALGEAITATLQKLPDGACPLHLLSFEEGDFPMDPPAVYTQDQVDALVEAAIKVATSAE